MIPFRNYVVSFEDRLPVAFNWARYLLHVAVRKDIVYPSVTKEIFKIIDSQNAIAIDVGANVGIVTRYLSQYFKVTHAIEPMPYLASRLKNLQNARIKVHHCALGADDGRITMRTPVGDHGQLFHALSTASTDNALKMFAHQSVKECVVPQHRLSTLIGKDAGRVGYLKIDVEGFEYAVLQGAAEMLSRDRPIVQMEIERTLNPNYMRVVDLFNDSNYTGYAIDKLGLHNTMLADLKAQAVNVNLALDALINNQYDFIFIPNEKNSLYSNIIT
jgi:FkbM family methyltransferase